MKSMNITFAQFLEQTSYSAPYAARKIKYFPESRPALIAKAMGLDVKAESKVMVAVINGSLKLPKQEIEPKCDHKDNLKEDQAA